MSLIGLTIKGENGAEKHIPFYKDGKVNEKQLLYFNNLLGSDYKLRGNFDEFSYFGAFRCGKSFSQQAAVFLICATYPKTKALYVRDTYDQLKDSVIKQFLDEFEYLGIFTYIKSERKCYFRNGSTLVFRAFDKDTGILSTEYDLAAVCQVEDIQQELFLQLFGRLSGKILPRPLLLTEGNPASGFVKERYKDQSREVLRSKGIYFLEGSTQDNPWVTSSYIQRLIDNYPKWWLDRYLYGLWDNREELIYSEFNENIHVVDIIDPKEIHKDYIRRNGFDWGWVNPSACLFGYTDYDSNLTIYDEYYKPSKGLLLKDIANDCNRHGKFYTVADHAMKGLKLPAESENKHEERTIWTELERYGMRLLPCNKEELSNIVLVNTLFKTNKIHVTRNCVNAIKEWKNWKWKQIKLGTDRSLPEEPVDKNNHTCDALDYLVAELFGREAKDSAKEKLHNESILKAVMKKDFSISNLS